VEADAVRRGRARGALLCAVLLPVIGFGQTLAPRTHWPAPRGTSALILGYQYQSGDVVTDPSLPLTGVDSDIHIGLVAWQRTTALFGRTAKFQLELPYTIGTTRGLVEGLPDRRCASVSRAASSPKPGVTSTPSASIS
jgi:hypothetical protein